MSDNPDEFNKIAWAAYRRYVWLVRTGNIGCVIHGEHWDTIADVDALIDAELELERQGLPPTDAG